jgi:hypothetical protein
MAAVGPAPGHHLTVQEEEIPVPLQQVLLPETLERFGRKDGSEIQAGARHRRTHPESFAVFAGSLG